MLTRSYTAIWFLYSFIAGSYSQFIEYQENKQARKISERKICAYTGMSEKWSLSYTNEEKSGQSSTFCWKKGLIVYLAAVKKGAIRNAHPYYAIYRKPRPPPPPPHHHHTHTHTHTDTTHPRV